MERNNDYTYVRRQGQMISPGLTRRPPMQPREIITQHDELIQYIKEAWMKVNQQGPHGGPVFYSCETEPPRPPGFTPFDLDSYWGQKLIQNIHISQGHQ